MIKAIVFEEGDLNKLTTRIVAAVTRTAELTEEKSPNIKAYLHVSVEKEIKDFLGVE